MPTVHVDAEITIARIDGVDTSTNITALDAAADPRLADFIVKTPGVCSGQPRIAGTRIKVKHVYVWVEQMGMSPTQVVTEYPHLTMAQVHAALAYYWSHQAEIQQDIENEQKLVTELEAKAGSSKLQERLTGLNARSEAARQRIAELIAGEKARQLSSDETLELDEYMAIEHRMRLAKARDHRSSHHE